MRYSAIFSIVLALLLAGGGALLAWRIARAVPEAGGSPPAARSPALDKLEQALRAQLAGRREEADQLYRQAVELDPALRGVAYQRAVLQFHQGNFDEARWLLALSIERGEEVAASHNLRGVMLGQQGQHVGALAEFERAIQAQPYDPQGYYNASEALRHIGKAKEAEAHLRRAINRKPGDPLFHFKRRMAVIAAGESRELRDLVTETKEQLQLDPPAGDWLLTAAGISLARNELGEAAAMLSAARDSMDPQLFYAMLQDPLFLEHAQDVQIAPFYNVTVTLPSGEQVQPQGRP